MSSNDIINKSDLSYNFNGKSELDISAINSVKDYKFYPIPKIEVTSVKGEWSDYYSDITINLSNGHYMTYYFKGSISPMEKNKIVIKLCKPNSDRDLIISDIMQENFLELIAEWGSIPLALMKLYEKYYYE